MDYTQITSFLEKFKKILFQKEEVCKIIAKIISKHTSFPIEPNLIKIKNATIYIKGTPILLNQILIYKNKILFDLKKEIPNLYFKDIK
jgi:hypothetical protein